MKRVNIILIALSLLLVGQLWAQQNRTPWHSMSELPRRPWSTFDGDTVRYLEFNYTIRGMQYTGWTVGELLDELELPVIGIVCWTTTMATGAGTSSTPLIGLTFGIRQAGRYHHQLRDCYINVRFENPPCIREFNRLSPILTNGIIKREITPEVYSFIKDLRIASVGSNSFIIRDSELQEMSRRRNEEAERRGREARDFLDRFNRAESEEERELLREESREHHRRESELQREREQENLREREHWREQNRAREESRRREREREENQRQSRN